MPDEAEPARLPDPEGVEVADLPAAAFEYRPFAARPGELAAAAEDWVYFTHALLYSLGGMDRDVVAMAYERAGIPEGQAPGVLSFPTPLLTGRVTTRGRDERIVTGSNILLAAPRVHWDLVYDAIRAVSGLDRRAGRFWRTTTHLATVYDPTWQYGDRRAGAQLIQVHLFGLDANFGRFTFEVSEPWGFPIRVRKNPPCDGTLAMAKLLLEDESHRPFRAVEPTEQPPDVVAAVESLVIPEPVDRP